MRRSIRWPNDVRRSSLRDRCFRESAGGGDVEPTVGRPTSSGSPSCQQQHPFAGVGVAAAAAFAEDGPAATR